jgi:hypothetical protein
VSIGNEAPFSENYSLFTSVIRGVRFHLCKDCLLDLFLSNSQLDWNVAWWISAHYIFLNITILHLLEKCGNAWRFEYHTSHMFQQCLVAEWSNLKMAYNFTNWFSSVKTEFAQNCLVFGRWDSKIRTQIYLIFSYFLCFIGYSNYHFGQNVKW